VLEQRRSRSHLGNRRISPPGPFTFKCVGQAPWYVVKTGVGIVVKTIVQTVVMMIVTIVVETVVQTVVTAVVKTS